MSNELQRVFMVDPAERELRNELLIMEAWRNNAATSILVVSQKLENPRLTHEEQFKLNTDLKFYQIEVRKAIKAVEKIEEALRLYTADEVQL